VVSFKVDDYQVVDRTGWSVLVVGTAEVVHDLDVTFKALAAHLEPFAAERGEPEIGPGALEEHGGHVLERDDAEAILVCPLVMDGTCPLGDFDAVVSALDGPWASPIRRAWEQSTTRIVDASTCEVTDPSARLAHHIGAAMHALWPAGRPEGPLP
jgi:hypothetical protein